MGPEALARGEQSIAVGVGAEAHGKRSMAIGHGVKVYEDDERVVNVEDWFEFFHELRIELVKRPGFSAGEPVDEDDMAKKVDQP